MSEPAPGIAEGASRAAATVAKQRPDLLVVVALVVAFLYVFDRANDRLATKLESVSGSMAAIAEQLHRVGPCPCIEDAPR